MRKIIMFCVFAILIHANSQSDKFGMGIIFKQLFKPKFVFAGTKFRSDRQRDDQHDDPSSGLFGSIDKLQNYCDTNLRLARNRDTDDWKGYAYYCEITSNKLISLMGLSTFIKRAQKKGLGLSALVNYKCVSDYGLINNTRKNNFSNTPTSTMTRDIQLLNSQGNIYGYSMRLVACVTMDDDLIK